ncbi:MAG: glycosyltransferase family 39 protein [Lachnospiraceae bacterium]|nr:glycosyltransferase family 39 protein [Lachnospiraceae bacterium]
MSPYKERLIAAVMILAGSLARLVYVLNTSVYERTHDAGYYSSLTDGIVNPGHLGYIEYFAKFGHMPDFDPFSQFSYFHPPVHHFLASLVVRFSVFCGSSVDAAFENVQFLTLFYSVCSMILAYLILKEVPSRESCGASVLLPLFIWCAHPGTVYMAATVNNDMMTVMMEFFVILFFLRWIRTGGRHYLYLTALFLGLGMLVKISIVILAFPVGLVMLLRRKGNFRPYLVFFFLSVPLGLSFTVRNFLRFHQKPGISSATPDSFLYMGNLPLSVRLGIPSSLGLDYPFHSVYAKDSTNVWVILFKTSLFGEIRPDVTEVSLFLLRALYLIAIVLGLLFALFSLLMNLKAILVKQRAGKGRDERDVSIVLLGGYFIFMAAYVAFVIKYPYTCSCDFRYVTATLLFGLTGLKQVLSAAGKRRS